MKKLWLLTILALLVACGEDEVKRKVEVKDNEKVAVEAVRFDQLMYRLIEHQNAGGDCNLWYQQHMAKHRRLLAHWLLNREANLPPDAEAHLIYQIDSFVTKHPALADEDLRNQLCEWTKDKHTKSLLDTARKYLNPKLDLKQRLQMPLSRLRSLFPEEVPAQAVVGGIVMAYGPGPLSQFYPKDELMTAVLDNKLYLMVGLDYFAGPDFPILHPELLQSAYYRARFADKYTAQRIMSALISNLVHPPVQEMSEAGAKEEKAPTFLSLILQAGMDYNLLELVLDSANTADLFYWTPKQLAWAQQHEAQLYKKFLPLLYETQPHKYADYIYPRPKLNMADVPGGAEAPSYLGYYVGYRIIQKYLAKYPKTEWPRLLKRTDWQRMLKESGYKPGLEED